MSAVAPTVGPTPSRARGSRGRRPGDGDENIARDRLLVTRVRAGDDQAFEEVFRKYHAPLLSYCSYILGGRADGEDAVQQVFISALKSLRSSSNRIELRPWLYRIAHNRCISTIRTRRDHVELTEAVAAAPSDTPAGQYHAYVEVNTEGDYNPHYDDHSFPTPTSPSRS